MTTNLPDPLLSRLSSLIEAQLGLHFPPQRWAELDRKFDAVARDFECEDSASCLRWLESSPLSKSQIEILASHLTVGETYFFRERPSFDALREHILPLLVRSRQGTERRLKIWSAGCSTGEEPYSIAILLSQALPNWENWHLTILGTDINARFLQRAKAGVYREWSFRRIAQEIKTRFFKRTAAGYFEILPRIRETVGFSYLNLVEDTYPSLLNGTTAMDIIFCRNVLMYLAEERRQEVIQRLYRSLVDGGWLILGLSEVSSVLLEPFVTVRHGNAVVYRKERPLDRPVQEVEPVVPPAASKIVTARRHEPLPEVRAPVQEKIQPSPYEGALALFEQGLYAEAAARLDIAAGSNTTVRHARDIALLVRAYANQGKLTEALAWCEKGIMADKQDPSFHYLRATIMQEQGRLEEAVHSLRRTLYLDRDFVLAHFTLGNIARQQGNRADSERHFENVLSILSAWGDEQTVPQSEGMTAGRLVAIVRSITENVA